MHQTEPQNPLPLVFKITDPFDTNTYYVRAVVRDSLTGEIIKSVNLTSQGGGRFTTQINAPADPTGLGRHIDITKTVYTDSGYTTKSDAYREEIDYWYIKAAPLGGGGSWGGGEEIDYERIRDMIRDVLEEKIKPTEPIDLTNIIKTQEEIIQSIQAIEPAVFNERPTDLTPVLTMIQSRSDTILQRIGALPKEATPKTDITPILDEIKLLFESLDEITEVVRQQKGELKKEAMESIQEAMRPILEKNAKLKKILAEVQSEIEMPPITEDKKEIEEEEDKKEEVKMDIISPYIKRR